MRVLNSQKSSRKIKHYKIYVLLIQDTKSKKWKKVIGKRTRLLGVIEQNKDRISLFTLSPAAGQNEDLRTEVFPFLYTANKNSLALGPKLL